MNLCEIKPVYVYKWFMEMFVDSSDWVMSPNVYGMGLFSDGGIFATKPYICGSSYFLKMMDFKKGDWCNIMDGLYWRFINKNRSFFMKNPRLSMMVRIFDKMNSTRKEIILKEADKFIKQNIIHIREYGINCAEDIESIISVSYTHLTLPTIYSV